MTTPIPLLVFTDLDGTLIDHVTYDWAPARDALQAVLAIGGGIILASSKTAAEMTVLRRQMGLDNWPIIVENGAGCLPPDQQKTGRPADYKRIRACLDRIAPDLRRGFTGFGDMTVADVTEITGLSPKAAALAKKRDYSEPGLWQGTPDAQNAFIAALATYGMTARAGGRFLTLSFGARKSDQMATLVDHYRPRHTLALGDAPNDIDMLEAAAHGIIIANPHHAPLPELRGEKEGRITRTDMQGPAGWAAAVGALMTQLDLSGI